MADLLRVEGVSRRFGGLQAVREMSLTQAEREVVAVIGPNGAGKSTLFNIIGGTISPSSGSVFFQGQRVSGRPQEALARLGLVKTFQTSRPFTSMTFAGNVMTAAFARTRDKGEARDTALQMLDLVGLGAHAATPARGASTGQRKRLELARALATRPRLLLLDEPFGGVDQAAIESLIGLLQRIRDTGVTILLVEHNLDAVRRLADRVVAMSLGAKIADGAPDAVLADARVVKAYLGDDEAADAA